MASDASVTLTQSQSHSDTNLLKALQLIYHAPLEKLHAYLGQASFTSQKLSIALSASPPARCNTTTNSVLALFSELQQLRQTWTDHLLLSEDDAIGETLEREDPNFFDMRFSVSARSSRKFMFQRGLKYRRLALDYEKWEEANFDMSTISTILDELKNQSQSASGHISTYVSKLDFMNKEATIRDIRYGIKMLVFERLCEMSVVSALLSFTYTRFRNLKYKDLPEFQSILTNSPWISTLVQKERWYQQCQEIFDSRIIQVSIQPTPTLATSNKRLAEPNISSPEPQTKRHNMSGEFQMDRDIGASRFEETGFLTYGDNATLPHRL